MLGAIAGDIAGSRFEHSARVPGNFELFHRDCRFTDDTVCTIAVAEAMLSGRGFADVMREFVRAHPDRGYGGMFLRWAFQDSAAACGSWGNGAPMRVSAVGWLAGDETEVLRLAKAQAAISHDHPDAVAASQAVALAIHLLRFDNEPRQVRSRLENDFGYALGPERIASDGGIDVSAAGTVPPALAAALASASWEEAVRSVIGLGGDTDTLGCIAGSVAEAIHGLPDEIAETAEAHLTKDLRAVVGRFRDHLKRL